MGNGPGESGRFIARGRPSIAHNHAAGSAARPAAHARARELPGNRDLPRSEFTLPTK